MNNPDVFKSPATPKPGSLQRMVRAIRDLLDHPFPHDLVNLRRIVAGEYGGDDAAAKSEMEEWCSQELCDRELDAYISAKKNGNAIASEYGSNDKADRSVRSSELVNRRSFEAWIASPPYERDCYRWPMDETEYAWPGQYKDIAVQLAWEAWCEAANTQLRDAAQ